MKKSVYFSQFSLFLYFFFACLVLTIIPSCHKNTDLVKVPTETQTETQGENQGKNQTENLSSTEMKAKTDAETDAG
ncbi:MAG: hypothetical protein Q4C70_15540, partial [Planctomycetia bacterium]|nr:hypothetical protein [Planctomycetia bacterium]